MAIVRVPKPPESAFNPDRPVSSLLKTQILHLHEAELRLPVRHQTDIYINKIRTEGEAAEYIRRVTAKLHPEGAPLTLTKKKKSEVRHSLAAMVEEKTGKGNKRKSGKKRQTAVSKSKKSKAKATKSKKKKRARTRKARS
jgi:hypothetical protein